MSEKEDISARDTSKLDNRIKLNVENQNFNLEDWIFSDQNFDNVKRVLEISAGTGRQSARILDLTDSDTDITLNDISKESCNMLEEKYGNLDNVSVVQRDMDILLEENIGSFDYVFVSYALYYTKLKEAELCEKLRSIINPGGKLVVVGPYQGNNFEFFGFLGSYGVKLPRLVTYCCDNFMNNLMLELTQYANSVKFSFAENHQDWDSAESLFNYWKNTIYFDETLADDVKKGLNNFFKEKPAFHLTKKISKLEVLFK